ncbi:MAG: hypothetical protein GWP91_06725 [Rhodobacterales bacterium]|nr:hypothetical protein [Rhodobacterales bacterium]
MGCRFSVCMGREYTPRRHGRWAKSLPLGAILLLGGCGSKDEGGKNHPTAPVTTTTTTTTTTSSTTPQLPACSPALALTPAAGQVPPFQLIQFHPSGGSGDYRFALAPPSNGDIHPTAGTYGAPGVLGSTDEVVLTDAQCDGEARASIDVVETLSLLPTSASVLPQTAFDFETYGGIGTINCTLVVDGSGATLGPNCSYQAGPNHGVDLIEAADDAGYTAEATIVVDASAHLEPEGYAHLVLPLGASYTAAAAGGSGVLDPTVLSGALTVVNGVLHGAVAGRSTVEFTDRFAGFSYQVAVDVVAPLVPDAAWMGARSADSRAVGPGDINGDGYDDVVFGSQELNLDRYKSGAVFVYAGSANGIVPTAAQVFSGSQRDQLMGSSLSVVDVNGDGQLDLLVGSSKDDFTDVDIGSVRVHLGISGGFFEDEPEWTLHGVNSYDYAGASLGACDFDGDGYVDIVVGADGAEDRSILGYPNRSGAVFVFKGSATGFVDAPATTRYGQQLNDGVWTLAETLYLGDRDLAVGDVNGDGLCDVMADIADAPVDGVTVGEGYALVWHGTANGILTADPVRAYANYQDSSADFGRRLALADFDGDGSDDVVVGSHAWSAASNNSGGLFVYLSSQDDGRAPTSPYAAAEAHWFATAPSSDYLGRGLAVGDVDGDGVPDLIGGVYTEDESFTNAGQVRVWSGIEVSSGAAGDRYDLAFTVWDGDEDDARLGESVAAAGDVDGDGALDLAAWACEHDAYGEDVGRGFVWSAGTATGLNLSGAAAGEQAGAAVTWFDTDGDGVVDVVSGAPQTSVPTEGTLTGDVVYYRANGGGFDTNPVSIPPDGELISSNDRYGEFLSGASDFNGDGWLDLVIGSRAAPSPATYDAAWNNGDSCDTGWVNAGAIYVHLGGPSGVDLAPSFVWFTTPTATYIEAMTAGFDFNGDGRDDVIVADEDWDAVGGFSIVYGRDSTGSLEILCNDPLMLGQAAGGRLGHAVTPMGDLNQDGCDDVAVSADNEDGGTDDRGVIHILWGYGRGGCPAGPTKTALGPNINDAEAGTALAGGRDVDGDGIPDLVVGSEDLEIGNTETGGVWLVSGAYILSLPSQSYSTNSWIGEIDQVVHDLIEPGRLTLLGGPAELVGFGRAIALVPDPIVPGRSAVALGMPTGDIGGTHLSGGVLIYRWSTSDDTWESSAYAAIGGESHLPNGELGFALSGSLVNGASTLLVGAPWSHQGGPDRGAVYVAPLE